MLASPGNGSVFDIPPSGENRSKFVSKKRKKNRIAKGKTPVIFDPEYAEGNIGEIAEPQQVRHLESFREVNEERPYVYLPEATPQRKKQKQIIIFQSPTPSPEMYDHEVPMRIVLKKKSAGFASASPKSPRDDDDDVSSTHSSVVSNIHTKKLLSGFHPYYDEESDVMALQCSTCCIGCWRNCAYRCTGCENFWSFPIYCWVGFLLPFFLLLIIGLIVTALYAAGTI